MSADLADDAVNAALAEGDPMSSRRPDEAQFEIQKAYRENGQLKLLPMLARFTQVEAGQAKFLALKKVT
jgi:hypothetical protein